MKKFILPFIISLIFFLFTTPFSFAVEKFWVGGQGNWNDQAHWSLESGGKSGAPVPTASDNVVFDKNSFTEYGQHVNINIPAFSRDFIWNSNLPYPVFDGKVSLNIYGSFILSEEVKFIFSGDLYFKSKYPGNIINTKGKQINCNFFFDNENGEWKLQDHILLAGGKSIYHQSGKITSNDKFIKAEAIYVQGRKAFFELGHSKVIVSKETGWANSTDSKVNSSQAKVIVRNKSKKSNGNETRGIQSVDSISYTIVQPSCNNSSEGPANDGSITITNVYGATGPFGYEWTGGSLGAGTAYGNPLINIGPGSYAVLITDSSTMEEYSEFITVNAPNPLASNFTKKIPTCFGYCNGWLRINPIAGSGTPPYTYLWGDNQTGQTDTALCASSTTVRLTDSKGCSKVFSTSLGQPQNLIPNVSTTNISCYNTCDGSAIANPRGGTGTTNGLLPSSSPGGYTYFWNPNGESTAGISALCPGTYTVTVTDDSLCTGTQSITIIQPDSLVLNPSFSNITCGGACDGTASVTPAGGTLPYNYTWTANVPGSFSGSSLSGLCPGIYAVKVEDVRGCSDSITFVITEPNSLLISLNGTNVTCSGNCDGTATAIPTGGSGPYHMTWTNGVNAIVFDTIAATSSLNDLCPDTYIVSVTDANNCSVSETIIITEPSLLDATATITNVSCNGTCDGTATGNASGGTGPYSYSWNTNPVQTSQSISNLCPGQYTVTITDDHGCIDSTTVTITEPLIINALVSDVNASCNVICDGSAEVTPGGGTPPYTYLWNTMPAQTTAEATNLCVGSYIVTVYDFNGCSITLPVQINPFVNITINSTGTDISCKGECDGQATATGSGGSPPYTYTWNTVPAQTGQTAINLCADSVTVTVTDQNGCTHSVDTVFVDPPVLTLNFSGVADATCATTCNGMATVNASGGTGILSYLWNTSPVQTSATVNNLCTGYHRVTVTDENGCSIMDSVLIDGPDIIQANPTVQPATCGVADGEVLLNATGGTGPYQYEWSDGQTTNPATNLGAGVYSVIITDNALCMDTFNVIVNSITGPNLITSSLQASCFGVCDGTITVTPSGGTPGYTYKWFNMPTQTDSIVTGLCAGIYFVTATDADSCATSVSDTVQQPSPILAQPNIIDVSCNGFCNGSIILNPEGGNGDPYSFLWQNGSIDSTRTNLCSGNYPVTITDAQGCSVNEIINVGAITVINSNPQSQNITCSGACDGLASVNASGGTLPYSYSWSPSGDTTPSITNICPGLNLITITDNNGCVANQSFTITEPSPLLPVISKTNVSCFGACNGSASVTVSGSSGYYTYFWTITGQTTPSVNNLCAGNYTVTICDSLSPSCCVSVNVNISEPPLLTVAASGTDLACNSICTGTLDASASGGTGPYNYLWLPLNQSDSSQSGVCPGTYSVTVTDADGCIAMETVIVSEPAFMLANASSNATDCGICDGSASVNPSGGTPPYTYIWSNNDTNFSINDLCAGMYVVMITDFNGCSLTENIAVINSNGPSGASQVTSDVSCFGIADGSASVSPTGGTAPYYYYWLPGGFTGDSISNAAAGTYNVQVMDANKCIFNIPVIINGPSEILSNPSFVEPDCGSTNGEITLTPDGGSGVYTFNWAPGGDTSAARTGLAAGLYPVTITDNMGCVKYDTIALNNLNGPIITTSSTNAACSNSCTGTATASASGGSGIFDFDWTGAFTGDSISSLCPGNYTVTVRDTVSGCIGFETVTIAAPSSIYFGFPKSTNVSCESGCNGTSTVFPTGGVLPYNYVWNPDGQTSQTANGLCEGINIVTVTDYNGCVAGQTIITSTDLSISLNATTVNASCGICDGSASVNASGGTGPYTYLWSNGATSGMVSDLCAGIYSVEVKDSKGCSEMINVNISNNSGPSGENIVVNNVSCFGLSDGSAMVTPIGGVPPYTYLWVPGAQTDNSVDSVPAGSYSVEIEDANGCKRISPVIIDQPDQIAVHSIITNSSCLGCNGSIDLIHSGGTPTVTYNWISTGLTTPSLIGLCSGLYDVIITDTTNGCVDTLNIPVSNTNGPSAKISLKDENCFGFCDGTVTVTAGGDIKYQWTPAVSTSSSANNLCSGTYIVEVKDTISGCVTFVSATLNSPDELLNSSPIIINDSCNGSCKGSASVIYNGGVLPYTYTWSAGSATSLCAGTHTVIVTDFNGCTATENINITEPLPIILNVLVIDPVCNNVNDGAINITVSGGTTGYSYVWSGDTPIFADTTEDIINLYQGTYTVEITDALGCKKDTSITLTAITEVSADAGPDLTYCKNSGSVVLTAAGAESYKWYVLPGMVIIGTDSVMEITPPSGATNYVLATYVGTCTAYDTVTVNINSLPELDGGSNTSLFAGESTLIGGSPTSATAISYLWSPSESLSNSKIPNPNATPATSTTYYIQVTDANGCVSVDSVFVEVIPAIVFPSGITPNKDGLNDLWIIDQIHNFPKSVVEVYNRWGEMLFRSNPGYTNPWDGTFKGDALPVGTYYFIINLHDDHFTEPITGPITIMK